MTDADQKLPEHRKLTAEGFTHWSSPPGNLTFDPDCPRCWYERGVAEGQRLAQRLREALGVIRDGTAEQMFRWILERVEFVGNTYPTLRQRIADIALSAAEPEE